MTRTFVVFLAFILLQLSISFAQDSTITITADNTYSLIINGNTVASLCPDANTGISGPSSPSTCYWAQANSYSFDSASALIAVIFKNDGTSGNPLTGYTNPGAFMTELTINGSTCARILPWSCIDDVQASQTYDNNEPPATWSTDPNFPTSFWTTGGLTDYGANAPQAWASFAPPANTLYGGESYWFSKAGGAVSGISSAARWQWYDVNAPNTKVFCRLLVNATGACPGGSTPSVSPSISRSPSISVSRTPSISVSSTPSISVSPTPSISVSPTPSISVTSTPGVSITSTPSISVSSTPSISVSPTPSISVSPTPSISVTSTPGVSITSTPSISVSPTPSVSVTSTPGVSITPSPSISISPTPSASVTPAPSISISPAPSISITPTPELSISPTPSISVSPTPSISPYSPLPSISPTPSTSPPVLICNPTPSSSPEPICKPSRRPIFEGPCTCDQLISQNSELISDAEDLDDRISSAMSLLRELDGLNRKLDGLSDVMREARRIEQLLDQQNHV